MLTLFAALALQDVVFPDKPAGEIAATPEAIAKLAAALGSDDHQAREDATVRLFWAGEPARDALKKVAASDDLEASTRAKGVLKLLDALAALKPVDVKFKVRGYCMAGSIEDPEALGGYAKSDNLSRALRPGMAKGKTGLCLIAEPDAIATFGKTHRGMRVSLANPTDKELWVNASDSRLDLVQQAMDDKGQWQDVEYLPGSF